MWDPLAGLRSNGIPRWRAKRRSLVIKWRPVHGQWVVCVVGAEPLSRLPSLGYFRRPLEQASGGIGSGGATPFALCSSNEAIGPFGARNLH